MVFPVQQCVCMFQERNQLIKLMNEQHLSEQNAETYKLKLEQDEETEKLRKVSMFHIAVQSKAMILYIFGYIYICIYFSILLLLIIIINSKSDFIFRIICAYNNNKKKNPDYIKTGMQLILL